MSEQITDLDLGTSEVPELEEYRYGFHDDVESVFTTGAGLTEEIVREISRVKEECLNF